MLPGGALKPIKTQCTRNGIWRRFRATIVAVEKQCVLHNLRVCTVFVIQHAMRIHHIVICVMSRSTIFFHISHEQHNFRGEKSSWTKNVLFFYKTFVWNNSHSTKKLASYDKNNICSSVVMQCTLNSCQILMKLEFSRQIFEKSNIKFHENPSSGSRVVPCGRLDGQTNRHDEADSRFSQFCERA